jgi:hypothetical protein
MFVLTFTFTKEEDWDLSSLRLFSKAKEAGKDLGGSDLATVSSWACGTLTI